VDQRIIAGLAKVALVQRHAAWARGGLSGVTPTQAQILALLAGRPGEGISVTDIAGELAVSQPTISDAVSALERKGLLNRRKCDDDGRVVRCRLTRKGAHAAAMQFEWPDALRQSVEALDAAEKASFLQLLIKMIHALQERGQIPIARMCPSCRYFRPNVHADAARPHHCAFVDAPLAGADLRLDCTDHEMLPSPDRDRLWSLFVHGKPHAGGVPASSS
jgi:DNA-binding MarR family transcriptional regulator